MICRKYFLHVIQNALPAEKTAVFNAFSDKQKKPTCQH